MVSDLSLFLSQHMSLLLYILSPIQMRRAVTVAGVGTCCPVKVKQPHKIFSFVYSKKFSSICNSFHNKNVLLDVLKVQDIEIKNLGHK